MTLTPSRQGSGIRPPRLLHGVGHANRIGSTYRPVVVNLAVVAFSPSDCGKITVSPGSQAPAWEPRASEAINGQTSALKLELGNQGGGTDGFDEGLPRLRFGLVWFRAGSQLDDTSRSLSPGLWLSWGFSSPGASRRPLRWGDWIVFGAAAVSPTGDSRSRGQWPSTRWTESTWST